MEDKRKDEEKVMGILSLITLRKSDLFNKILVETSKKKDLSRDDKDKIKDYISSMKNELFLSEDEKKDKKINAQLELMKLKFDFNKIIKESLGGN